MPATIIIDSVFIGPTVRRRGQERTQDSQWEIVGLTGDDIADLTVYRGADAIARGACPGTGLIVVKTKAGGWRAPLDVLTGPSETCLLPRP